MPADIRSFFGGKPASGAAEKPMPKAEDKSKKRGRARKVVDDDEDEDETPKRATPKKSKPVPAVELEETTADDFFGKGSKPKRSEAVRSAPTKPTSKDTPKKSNGSTKNTPKATPKKSPRAKKSVSYAGLDVDDFPDDDLDMDGGDNFKSDAKVGRRAGDDYEEGSDEDEDLPVLPKRKAPGRQSKSKADEDDFDPDGDVDMKGDDDDFVVPDEDVKPTKKAAPKSSKKRKFEDDDEDDLEIEETKPAKKRASPAKKAKPAPKGKAAEPVESATMKAIFDSIPTVDAPEPPSEAKKFQFGAHANSATPAGAMDPSDFPKGAPNCLAGLTFVFTGQLQRLARETGQNLVKEYGGKITGAPSKKTSYVVLGDDAGPKKLAVIKQNGIKTINEDGLFALISKLPANGGDSAAAEKYAEKLAKEEENIRKAAEEEERQEKARLAAAKPKPQQSSQSCSQANGKAAADGPDSRLWTVRYAPSSLNQICGNKTQVEKLQRWLRAFPRNQKTKFKMAGADGSGSYRAVMIHGPPGIGKTTAAHLIAKLEGYDVVESNASDTRSKKLVETGLKGVLSTTSLMGYFGRGSDDADESKKKLVLIMDEVDGMSAGDRGGVGALAAVCKKSQIPMILICNDRKLPKMKPFDFVTYDLPFRRPTTDQIRSRISTIAFREGLKMPPNVMNALIEGTGADIRQVVNMLSTAKLDDQTMTFEDSKDMSKAWEKHIVLKPWDMVSKILNGQMFGPASKATLNEKQELYFNDHDFAPLMLQENYLGTKPQRANKYSGNPKMHSLATLDLISKAADSISDGDLVDRMIHGTQQQWSLMPAHAMFSFVRPASFVSGTMAGHQTRFTSWLGKNSNQSKLMRMIREIQGHMRLRTSADRNEIRQTYMPLLYERLVGTLEHEGKEAVPEIIELMDYYFLTKDDWDAIFELGVGENDMEKHKIETQAKATFTRQYNQASHPMPFMKASQVLAPKRAPAKERPDLEEAFEESEEEVVADDGKEDEEDNDISKDKFIKAPKKKKAAAGAKAGGSKKKKAKAGEDDDDEEEEKPKKGKGKAKAKK